MMLIPALCYAAWIMLTLPAILGKMCDPHFPALVQLTPYKTRLWFYIVLFLLYAISIFALSGPSWKKASLPVYREVSSLMLVLDLSPTMNATDLKPNRVTRAKYKIRDLINAAQNTQMGLLAFSQEAFTVSPLSQDANTLNALLDELSPEMMPVSGSDSGEGLVEGHKLLKQAGANHGNILLITASNPTAMSWNLAKTIAQAGGRLSVLAMLDNTVSNQTILANLRQLAQTGGGTCYIFTPDASDIQAIAKSINNKQIINNDQVENAYTWLMQAHGFVCC